MTPAEDALPGRGQSQWDLLHSALQGGVVRRSSELIAAGVLPATIADALHRGKIARAAPGTYHMPEGGTDGWEAALAAACSKMPKAVACMTTAGRLNGLVRPGPDALWIALPASAHAGTAGAFARRIVRWSWSGALEVGVGEIKLRGVTVRATDPARTVVDLFRFSRLLQDKGAPIAAVRQLAGRPGQLDAVLAIASTLRMPQQAMVRLRTAVEALR